MKKLLKSKKGFTLVELLAVIVVLAIIMVIATTQVNRTVKKARTNSFNESMQTVVKTAKLLIAQAELSTDNLRDNLEGSDDDYTVYVEGGNSQSGLVVISATSDGKFNNVDFELIDKIDKYFYYSNGTDKRICTYINDAGELSKTKNGTITLTDCPAETVTTTTPTTTPAGS